MTQAQILPENSGATSAVSMPEAAQSPSSGKEALLALVLDQLEEDQAQEVVVIPLEGKSSIADHMIVATGRSTRQVAAIASKLAERIKKEGYGSARVEGLPAADWVLIDASDVVVHLFRPEVRSFYNLERMWGIGEDAPSAVAGTA